MTRQTLSHREIVSQPGAWRQAIAAVREKQAELSPLIKQAGRRKTFIVGCGSSYWGARSASLLWRELAGAPVEAVTGGELLTHPELYYSASDELLVFVPTRSGHTGEIDKALRRMRDNASLRLISAVVYEQSPIAALANAAVTMPWASEDSVCQTRSFSSLVVAQAAALRLAYGSETAELDRLPAAAEAFIAEHEETLRQLAGDESWSDAIVFGQGQAFGIAAEGALILMEMSETHANYYHTLEVIHGPNVMSGASTLGILFQSNHADGHEQRVIRNLKERGSKVLVIGSSDRKAEYDCDYYLGVDGIEGDLERALVGLIAPQLLANFRALAKGVDPDQPNALVPWIPSPESDGPKGEA